MGGLCMEMTVDMIILDILRQMFADSALDDEGKERIYQKIFDSKKDGDIYEKNGSTATHKGC